MDDIKSSKTIVNGLRGIGAAIGKTEVATFFPGCSPDDDPFVDKACETIERGGTLDATCLASLIYYIADMMEQ